MKSFDHRWLHCAKPVLVVRTRRVGPARRHEIVQPPSPEVHRWRDSKMKNSFGKRLPRSEHRSGHGDTPPRRRRITLHACARLARGESVIRVAKSLNVAYQTLTRFFAGYNSVYPSHEVRLLGDRRSC